MSQPPRPSSSPGDLLVSEALALEAYRALHDLVAVLEYQQASLLLESDPAPHEAHFVRHEASELATARAILRDRHGQEACAAIALLEQYRDLAFRLGHWVQQALGSQYRGDGTERQEAQEALAQLGWLKEQEDALWETQQTREGRR